MVKLSREYLITCLFSNIRNEVFKEHLSEIYNQDIEFIDGEILRNRYYSVNNRLEILEYAKQFDWVNVIDKYYIPTIQKIINKNT